MKRYKYQAMVRLLPEAGAATAALPWGGAMSNCFPPLNQ